MGHTHVISSPPASTGASECRTPASSPRALPKGENGGQWTLLEPWIVPQTHAAMRPQPDVDACCHPNPSCTVVVLRPHRADSRFETGQLRFSRGFNMQ